MLFSGELNGRILREVVTKYGKMIKVGAILILRQPSVLHISSTCIITVTKKSLFGMLTVPGDQVNSYVMS